MGVRFPLWLSHHPEAVRERCAVIGGVAVCRRCLALWPLVFLLLGVQVVARSPGDLAADWLAPLLLIVPVGEFVLVHVGAVRYSAVRVNILTPVLAVVLARLLFRHMARPFDPFAVSVAALAGLPCLLAVMVGPRRRSG